MKATYLTKWDTPTTAALRHVIKHMSSQALAHTHMCNCEKKTKKAHVWHEQTHKHTTTQAQPCTHKHACTHTHKHKWDDIVPLSNRGMISRKGNMTISGFEFGPVGPSPGKHVGVIENGNGHSIRPAYIEEGKKMIVRKVKPILRTAMLLLVRHITLICSGKECHHSNTPCEASLER